MNRFWIFLVSAVLLNALSNVFYKFSSLHSGQRLLSLALFGAGLGIGSCNAFLLTRSMKGISLNTAYPVFSAASLALVALVSVMLFGEAVSVRKIVGIAVLVAGVILVSV